MNILKQESQIQIFIGPGWKCKMKEYRMTGLEWGHRQTPYPILGRQQLVNSMKDVGPVLPDLLIFQKKYEIYNLLQNLQF